MGRWLKTRKTCELAKSMIRASTIELSQLAIRNKLVYSCLVGGKKRREKVSGLLVKSQL